MLGGVLGHYWLRAPFLAAAILNAGNLLLVLLFLRETRTPAHDNETLSLNPFAPLRWAFEFKGLAPLIGVFLVLGLVGQIGGTIWVLFGQDRFGWNAMTVGLSLAGFGIFHALVQAFVAGPASERWGERRTILIGIVADSAAYIAIAFAVSGWVAFALLPLFCLGGIGMPAAQALLSSKVDGGHQGRLQGVLASCNGLIAALAPLAISAGYFATRSMVPNVIWLAGAALYALCLPLMMKRDPRPVAA